MIGAVRETLTSGRLAHLGQGRKMANLARDPRVVLRVEAELLQRLAEVYLGPGVKFPAFDDPPPGHVIHITPRRFGGVGPWSD